MRTLAFLTVALSLFLHGCGAKRPVLYPNAHYMEAGEDEANQDIEACIELAKRSGAEEGKGAALAARTGKSAVVGGATGAVIGAISGSVGQGSLMGAAGAGTAALVSGAFRSSENDPLFMRFVEICLHGKGYQTVGWK